MCLLRNADLLYLERSRVRRGSQDEGSQGPRPPGLGVLQEEEAMRERRWQIRQG